MNLFCFLLISILGSTLACYDSTSCPQWWGVKRGEKKCYQFIRQRTYQEAVEVCKARGGRLFEPRDWQYYFSSFENIVMKTWIAIERKGRKWVYNSDKQEIWWSRWRPGLNPDSGSKNCAVALMNQQFVWDLEDCNRKRNTFCEVDLCDAKEPSYCFVENLGIHGHKISTSKVQDRLACRQKCLNSKKCKAYTFYARRSNYRPGFTCELFKTVDSVEVLDVKARAASAPKKCNVSNEIKPFLTCFAKGLKIDGNVLNELKNVGNFDKCRKKCKKYRDCIGVTFYQNTKICQIFDIVFGVQNYSGAISGQRACESQG